MSSLDARKPWTFETTWTFVTNHTQVLLCLAQNPDVRLRDVADAIGITERAAQRILTDLVDAGYVQRRRVGRRNHYTIDRGRAMRHAAQLGHEVGGLLDLLELPRDGHGRDNANPAVVERPLPPTLEALIAKPNPAVIATIREDGSVHTAATWYDWEPGRILVNMDHSRRRLAHLRADPRVSLTILSNEDWYRHVTVMGHVTSLEEDVGLADIDRLSIRYRGSPYPARDRQRVSAWIAIRSWHSWPPELATA
jgi:PPOX class probable F420-dependent enzyme